MKEVEIIDLSTDQYIDFTQEPIGPLWELIDTYIRILWRVKLLRHQSDFKTLISLLGFQNSSCHINRKGYSFSRKVGKINQSNPKQNSREFLQKVRLWDKNTSVFLYSSPEITKAIFCILYFHSFNSIFNLC